MNLKPVTLTFFILILLAAAPAGAEAKGCIKGAIVGGVAGHVVGHGKLGALAGCVVGHHQATKANAQPSGSGNHAPNGR